MVGCGQNRHHAHDVWRHTLEVVRFAPAESTLRWAALLHDAGKPGTRSVGPDGEVHFYGHEARSLELTEGVFERLTASHALRKATLALIRHHGTHPTESWSDAACRRFLGRLEADGLALDARPSKTPGPPSAWLISAPRARPGNSTWPNTPSS